MPKHKVAIFKPYSFQVGQKIRIDGSTRGGDWEVTGVTESKVTLRCPLSNKEYTWDLFCYFTEEKDDAPWPME